MRTREEIEAWAESKQGSLIADEAFRMQKITVELLLDIREQLAEVKQIMPEWDQFPASTHG